MTYQEEFNYSHDTERILYLLRNHSDDIDPSDKKNQAIIWASEKGHVEIVKELLKDDRVNPSELDNLAIWYASMNGHVEVVKELLQDERVDPSVQDNQAITWASFNSYTEVVKILKDHIKFGRNTKLYSRMLIDI